MAFSLRTLFVALAAFAVRGARADCTSYGVDFVNGGSYYIDGSSSTYFSFISVFQGCSQEAISPILVDPDNNQYACSSINANPANVQVTSQCGIPWSAMRSGVWRIIIQGNQIGVQRSVTLTVGIPKTSTVFYTPTVVVGVTSTPRAQTIYRTVQATQTLIIAPGTVTANCNGGTQTVTNFPKGSTVYVTSSAIRTVTDGQKTSYLATTLTSAAECHYPTSSSSSSGGNGGSICVGPVCSSFGIGRRGEEAEEEDIASDVDQIAEKRDLAAMQHVNDVTLTLTETSYTYTATVVTTARPTTTTEVVVRTITATVQPPATTLCNGNGPAQYTVTVQKPMSTVTQTNVVYQTQHISGTVYIGATAYSTLSNPISATACWRAGGWYGV